MELLSRRRLRLGSAQSSNTDRLQFKRHHSSTLRPILVSFSSQGLLEWSILLVEQIVSRSDILSPFKLVLTVMNTSLLAHIGYFLNCWCFTWAKIGQLKTSMNESDNFWVIFAKLFSFFCSKLLGTLAELARAVLTWIAHSMKILMPFLWSC